MKTLTDENRTKRRGSLEIGVDLGTLDGQFRRRRLPAAGGDRDDAGEAAGAAHQRHKSGQQPLFGRLIKVQVQPISPKENIKISIYNFYS